jgi:hypothetical protein
MTTACQTACPVRSPTEGHILRLLTGVLTCRAEQPCDVKGCCWFGGAGGDWPYWAGLRVAGLVPHLAISSRAIHPSMQGWLCDGVGGVLDPTCARRRAVPPGAPGA